MAGSSAMFTALSGLQQNQTYMDVIGNNISNINTIGYKSSSVRFEDLLYNTISGAQSAANGREGVNAMQIGLGAATGEITTINTQGSLQSTGKLTDMAILGDGYFVVSDGQKQSFTRDGSFTIAPDGTLESASNGLKVQGYTAFNADGSINKTVPPTSLKLPFGQVNAAATANMSFTGNLDASQANYNAGPPATGGQLSTSVQIYDTQGNAHTLTLSFTKQDNNVWQWSLSKPAGSTDPLVINGAQNGVLSSSATANGTPPALSFDNNGNIVTAGATPSFSVTFNNGTDPTSSATTPTVTMDFSHVAQLAEQAQINMTNQDGTSAGTLSTFNVGGDGSINAIFTNGITKKVGVVQLANFQNSSGLMKDGQNLYSVSPNSGQPLYGQPSVGGFGQLATGNLEGSNVDLALQFTNMIQAQRGFSANTRVITASDQMMTDTINIVH